MVEDRYAEEVKNLASEVDTLYKNCYTHLELIEESKELGYYKEMLEKGFDMVRVEEEDSVYEISYKEL